LPVEKKVGHDLELIFADNVNKGNKKDVGTFPHNPTGNTEDRMMELITNFLHVHVPLSLKVSVSNNVQDDLNY